MRISDWTSDVCASDPCPGRRPHAAEAAAGAGRGLAAAPGLSEPAARIDRRAGVGLRRPAPGAARPARAAGHHADDHRAARTDVGGGPLQGNPADEDAHRPRSEEHTSELQSLMRISYAVF